jgi:predicted 2-oxoglutarate/Fe(II)-dependent dioxygenase YbiX
MSFDIRDYIVVFENIVPVELCDSILSEYSNTNEWLQTSTKGGVRLDIRSATTILMSTDQVINLNAKVRKKLDDDLFQCASKAIQSYNQKFDDARIEQDSGYELLRYETGQFYTTHTDSFREAPRAVSCSFSLNDNYEGGEFAFFNREIKIKIPKGSALMFPSNFMYPHEVMPVTHGTRFSIVTWFI